MSTYKLSIGDSTRGFTSAAVEKRGNKYYLKGEVNGFKYLVKNALKNINNYNDYTAVTSAGDCLDVSLKSANKTVKNEHGTELDWEAAFNLMDYDISNELSYKFAPCSEQFFFDEYCKAHAEKFGEEFELSKKNPCWWKI